MSDADKAAKRVLTFIFCGAVLTACIIALTTGIVRNSHWVLVVILVGFASAFGLLCSVFSDNV